MTKDKLTIGQGESLPAACAALWRENRLPFLSGLLAGLAAHGYAFGNKLLNHDEIESLFGKGATVTSGRWGLELVKLLFPDWSMPWIYGILSLLLISAAACLMLRVLDIRGAALKVVLPALILLGGLSYHLLFEAKSQYAMPYFVLMMPIAAYGLFALFRRVALR